MSYTPLYVAREPSRQEMDTTGGPLVLEFGAPWCGHCQAAQAGIAHALDAHSEVAHVKVEDGPGRPLGRSYRVKLWPTLVFLRDGEERERRVRPRQPSDIEDALRAILGKDELGS